MIVMTIRLIFLASLFLLSLNGFSTKYITKTGYAYFKSHTDAIDIDGSNRNVAAIIDPATGEIVVIVLIKAFDLPLATAKEHFNETYMESDKFPKATFKGKLTDLTGKTLAVNGEYPVTAEGTLTIHGQSREIKQKATMKVKNGEVSGSCKFQVNINDYGIVVPSDVKNRVAQVVDVVVEFSVKPQE